MTGHPATASERRLHFQLRSLPDESCIGVTRLEADRRAFHVAGHAPVTEQRTGRYCTAVNRPGTRATGVGRRACGCRTRLRHSGTARARVHLRPASAVVPPPAAALQAARKARYVRCSRHAHIQIYHRPIDRRDADISPPNHLALAQTPLVASSRAGSVSLHRPVVRLDLSFPCCSAHARASGHLWGRCTR
jgi:hypothetical protein